MHFSFSLGRFRLGCTAALLHCSSANSAAFPKLLRCGCNNSCLHSANKVLPACIARYERFRLAESLKTATFNSGDVIIKEGEPGDDFYIIESGDVVCTKRTMKKAA